MGRRLMPRLASRRKQSPPRETLFRKLQSLRKKGGGLREKGMVSQILRERRVGSRTWRDRRSKHAHHREARGNKGSLYAESGHGTKGTRAAGIKRQLKEEKKKRRNLCRGLRQPCERIG